MQRSNERMAAVLKRMRRMRLTDGIVDWKGLEWGDVEWMRFWRVPSHREMA